MSLLIPDTGLLFWMILSFGVVFFILAKYGFPVITKTVEKRKAYIDNSLKLAKEANEQMAKLKEDSESMIAAAHKEQGRIMKEAMDEREKIIRDARREAQSTIDKELAEAQKQIQLQKDEAIRDLRRQVAVLSVDIAEKIMRKELSDRDEQLEMIDRMIEKTINQN